MNKKIVKLFLSTTFFELILTAIEFALGVFIIRMFSIEQYASYAIVLSLIGVVNKISESGLSNSLFSNGALLWDDKKKFSVVFMSALKIKTRYTSLLLFVLVPYGIWILHKNNFESKEILYLLLSVVPSVLSNLISSLQTVPLRLSGDIKYLQTTNIKFSLVRVLLIGMCLYFFPNIALIIFLNGIILLVKNLIFRKHLNKTYSCYQEKANKKEINLLKRDFLKILPQAVFGAFNREIIIVIVSIFGTATMIGQVSGLRKASRIFKVLTKVYGKAILPIFAKKRFKNKKALGHSFFMIQFSRIIIGATIFGLLMLFSEQILWILGGEFSMFSDEFFYALLGVMIGFFSQNDFNLSRGYIPNFYLLICLKLILFSIILYLIPPISVINILIFGVFKSIITFFITNATFIYFNYIKIDSISQA